MIAMEQASQAWGSGRQPLTLEDAEELLFEQRRLTALVYETVFAIPGATLPDLENATGRLGRTIKPLLDELCGARGFPAVLVCSDDRWFPRGIKDHVSVV